MDAFLGGLGLGSLGGDAPRTGNGCNSIDDLQRQLHSAFTSKRGDTRAEHISATFELRQNAVLYIQEERESAGPDGLEPLQELATRTVNASEALLDQPQDNPALQKAVAKHIAGAVGVVDESTWNVRQVSRATQGWTFTYLCRHSLQAWNRQNTKTPARLPIGISSGNDGLDPVNLSRPAFDCRGTLTIAFSKNSRAIVVKYEHTPLHKTVSDLMDRLAPTLPPPPAPNPNNGNANRSTKAKRPPVAEGEESARKKRKRKKGKEGEDGTADDPAQLAAPDLVASGVHATSILNIPPVEAARRREVAINLLSGRNIDPVTLSVDQFSIFANQAPHLQELSLDMLAKYGAERLRIVHPDEKDQPSASSTPQQQNTPAEAGEAATAVSTPTTDTPSKKRRPRKSNLETPASQSGVEDVVQAAPASLELETGTATQAAAASRQRKTRGACNTCRQNKRKCTKEHPQCSVCAEAGDACVYLPPKPRRKSEKSAEIVEAEPSDIQEEEETVPSDQAQSAPQGTPQATQVTTMDVDNDEFIPDPNILSGPMDHSIHQQPAPTYYQPEASTVTFPQPSPSHTTTPQQTPGLTYSKGIQQPQPSPDITYTNTPAVASPPKRQATPRNQTRRSLPSAQSSQAQGPSVSSAAQSQIAQTWSNMPNSPAIPPANGTNTPAYSQQQAAKRPRSRKSRSESIAPVFDGVQAAAVLSQTHIPVPQPIQSPAVNRSPHQNPASTANARAKSRQGQRPQTHAPVTQTPVPPPQIPTSRNISTNPPNNASSAPPYDPFGRYNTAGNDQYSQSGSGQSSRIAYDPHSYQQPAASSSDAYTAPSYDYSRSSSTNPLSQALHDTSSFSNVGTSNTAQWTSSQARQTQSHTASNRSTTPYNAPTNNQTSPSHSYGTRSAQRQTATPTPSYNQSHQSHQQHQPSHSYNSFPGQQGTNPQQNQAWYGFSADTSSNNASYSSNTRNTGYGNAQPSSNNADYNQTQRPNAPGYHGYGVGDDLYEILRSGSSH
ncbi:uncharacterized protein JN550_000756 [Neoarthrinium moseri]|uniref:uncharacterized protein n=1 Tax=Neoarthrinium moseri TaxID=1658444 RepID=UPI001FDC6D38|nr:uncharacterized protein JN550_000756 [Neoarthrinium moseri]KAI1876684.1 hypothetical protein JN550_000756 [Neoarthrinium moseri]